MTRVCIVGGGIAGLTLAGSLDPRRFDVTIFEAEPARTSLGAAIGLWPSARRALAAIGVQPDVGVRPSSGSLFTVSGRRLARAPAPDVRLVRRPALVRALTMAVPPSVRLEMRQVDDPSALDADLVIGADGVRSRVRSLVQPSAESRVASSFVTLRGIVQHGAATEFGEYWGNGRLFGLAPVSDDEAYWFTAHRSTLGPEPLDPARVLDQARKVFDADASVIRRVLGHAGAGTIATRLWTTAPMTSYVRGRYVVIGDAAHASLPNLGRGACDAILDATSLARTLNRNGSLNAWQARRLPVTQAARVGASLVMRAATRSWRPSCGTLNGEVRAEGPPAGNNDGSRQG